MTDWIARTLSIAALAVSVWTLVYSVIVDRRIEARRALRFNHGAGLKPDDGARESSRREKWEKPSKVGGSA